MTRIKIHISNVKLPFYPPCEIKCGLQNRVSTTTTINPMKGIVDDVDEEEELVESKFEKMDDQDDIPTAYEKL